MRKKRVLILDDSEIVTTLTAFLVNGLGHESTQFINGKSVLEYIEDSEKPYPDLIIADHSLTTVGGVRKTGFKVLERIKTFGVDIPVIMASSNTNPIVKERYLKLGVVSYVCKDNESYIDVLLGEIKKVLDGVKETM